ncbi:hypothetical protein T02_6581 [Trichinella nativa]|uniref:Uncharacterized protein n=1 Tax=Trichinella nativa TaxID=6335 RepID=A0A0V1KZS2_9BILA|nr:hypothetical protein T02_6581 [Trichinella nativa]
MSDVAFALLKRQLDIFTVAGRFHWQLKLGCSILDFIFDRFDEKFLLPQFCRSKFPPRLGVRHLHSRLCYFATNDNLYELFCSLDIRSKMKHKQGVIGQV